MQVTKDELIDVLRLRYDMYSAEAVFELARQRAELPVQPALDARELAAFRAALEIVGDRVQVPLARIDDMLAAAPAPGKGDKKGDEQAATAKAGAEAAPAADAKASSDAPAADAKVGSAAAPAAEAKDANDAKSAKDGKGNKKDAKR